MGNFEGVDVQWDLNTHPYPFEENSVDRVLFRHVLEHLDNPDHAIEEAFRIARPNGKIEVYTPHFSSLNAYADLSHKHAFSLHIFDDYCDTRRHSKDKKARFRLVSRRLKFWRLHDSIPFVPHTILGITLLSKYFPTLYERFFCFIFPAMEMHIILEVQK